MLEGHLQKKNYEYRNQHQLSQPLQKRPQPSSNDLTQNEFIDIDNAQKVKVYFQQIIGRNQRQQADLKNAGTKELRGSVEKNVRSALMKGEIQASGKRGEIQKMTSEVKIKYSTVKSEQKRKTQERDNKRFIINVWAGKRQAALSNNVSEEKQLKLLQSRTSVLTKKQHKFHLDKISRERSEISLKKRQTNERQRTKQQEKQKRKNVLLEEELERAREQKKRKALSRFQEQKVKHQQQMKQQEQNNKKVNKIKQKKLLHEKLEEKYNAEVVIASLEERKKKLKEIRNKNKAYTLEQVNKFEREYMKKKQTPHAHEFKENIQWSIKTPQKPQKLSQMLEDENFESKLKLSEKKKRLEEKIQKQTQFLAHLKILNPMVELKTNRSQQNLDFSKAQQKPMPGIKSIGNSYLQETKKRKRQVMPQGQEMKNHSFNNDDGTAKKGKGANSFTCNKSEQEYSRIRDKRIEKILESSEQDNVSKIIQLRAQAQRLEEEQKRIEMKQRFQKNPNSEDGDKSIILLLASIKAKMGIIDLYNKN